MKVLFLMDSPEYLRFYDSAVEELLSREPLPLPRLEIRDDENALRGLEGLLAFRYEHLQLVGYKSHGKIEAPVAV